MEQQQQQLEIGDFVTRSVGCHRHRLDPNNEMCMAGRFPAPTVGLLREGPLGALELEEETRDGPRALVGFRDSCQGDSGSPVWKRGKAGTAVLVGLVSRCFASKLIFLKKNHVGT